MLLTRPSRIGLATSGFLAAWLAVCCASAPRLTAPTSAPRILEQAPMVFPRMTPEEYERMAASRSGNPHFIALRGDPADLGPQTRFSILPVGSNLVTVAIGGDSGRGLLCRADLDGDGVLAEDERRPMAARGGSYIVDLESSREVFTESGMLEGPLHFRLRLDAEDPGGDERLLVFTKTLRTGTIKLGRRRLGFGLIGDLGVYGRAQDTVLFDLDGDGQLAPEHPDPAERFLVSDEQVDIRGRSYAFTVDPLGRSLVLERLEENRPNRPVIAVGRDAPEFAVRDLEGRLRRLADYRGRVVLIDFWAVWCKPCVADAPKLVAAYEAYRSSGFAILGVHHGGTERTVREFVAEHGTSWPQILQEDGDTVVELFRVGSYPTYILIDGHGTVVSIDRRADELVERLATLFDE